jgi:anti-anti-sigma factor
MRSGKEWASLMHFMDPKERPPRRAVMPRSGPYHAAQVRSVVGESDELMRVTMRTDGAFPGTRSFRPGGPTIVTLRDDLDFAAAPALRERLLDVLHRGIDLLILDLSHVPSCDAVGLAVLVATQRRAGLLGVTMRLVAPSLPVSKLLGSTGLKRHFAICSELSGALAT